MKFFNIDMHASVIADVNHIFRALGHEVDDWSLSGHAHVMGKKKADITLYDGGKLLGAGICTQETCDKFYETFKDQLDVYDGFIACYPVEFAMLYERWEKPIICINCIRYEHPNSIYPNIWKRLDEFLMRYQQKGLLYFVCNNKGDQWYVNHFLPELKTTWIPSLCEYVGEKCTLENPQFLVHERSYTEGLEDNCKSLSHLRTSEWRYTWKDVYAYSGVIHVPYHNGSMSIFEHYTGNMPMFMPSKRFAVELFSRGQIFSDLTFYKIYNLPEPEDLNSPLSLRNPEILQKWIDTTDFYDPENMPHITYFDNWEHLRELLKTTDCHEVSEKMREYNVIRKEMVYNKWREILGKISST